MKNIEIVRQYYNKKRNCLPLSHRQE